MPTPTQRKGAYVALVGAVAALASTALVQNWEGREHVPYRDIVGIWTVCDGDTANVTPGKRETDAECDARLERQLIAHAKPVLGCTPRLQDHPYQLAAAVSLAYNIGPVAYCRSTAAKRFQRGDFKGGCDALLMWNKVRVNGRMTVVRGLDNRRRDERRICMTGL